MVTHRVVGARQNALEPSSRKMGIKRMARGELVGLAVSSTPGGGGFGGYQAGNLTDCTFRPGPPGYRLHTCVITLPSTVELEAALLYKAL